MENRISILDCTLRDGGYCNNWEFGYKNIKKIILELMQSNVNIIECGILCNGNYSNNQTKYSTLEMLSGLIPDDSDNKTFVVLMNYGEYDISAIMDYCGKGIEGIRVAFHKKDIKEAIEIIKIIKRKNYKVFMQPMVTSSYTIEEFIELIKLANEVDPYAFYIVDSFGSMNAEIVKKYSSIANYMLNDKIILGLHAHNNLQLAYSNSKYFIDEVDSRNLIVDSCIMGMGRGAGNLNTELFLSYMNEKFKTKYDIEPILRLIDEIVNAFYQNKYWGYSLPYYISAIFNMHPNYGTYLSDKNTLTISMLKELLSLVDIRKKNNFDKDYIESVYLSYMCANKVQENVNTSLEQLFFDKEILIIAPGKSIDDEYDKISEFSLSHNVIKICVNFNCKSLNPDYVFVSNSKRFKEISSIEPERLIITSNIETEISNNKVDYLALLCDDYVIRDNALMLLIKLLINSNAKGIYLAGVDGYSINIKKNYSLYSNAYVTSIDHMKTMNASMSKMLKMFSDKIKINYVTSMRNIFL